MRGGALQDIMKISVYAGSFVFTLFSTILNLVSLNKRAWWVVLMLDPLQVSPILTSLRLAGWYIKDVQQLGYPSEQFGVSLKCATMARMARNNAEISLYRDSTV